MLSKNKSKLFYNYLLSYIVILLIPLIILGVFCYTFFLKILKEEALVNNTNVLYRAQKVIEEQLTMISNMGSQVSANRNLKYFYLEEDMDDAQMTINELDSYLIMNPFVESIVYYNRGDKFLYTQTTSADIALFIEAIYPYTDWTAEDFYNDINTATAPFYRPMETVAFSDNTKRKVLSYVCPIGSNSFSYDRTLCFIIPEKSFHNLLSDAVNEYSGFSMILDEANNLITVNNPLTFEFDLIQNTLDLSKTDFNRVVQIDGEEYLFSCIKSQKNQWKYITLVSDNDIMKSVNTSTFFFGIIILATISIGAVIIVFMMSLNYSPIKRLKLLTQKIQGTDTVVTNEIDSVKNAIEYLSSQNEQLHVKLVNSSDATKDYLLSRIISGKIGEPAQINQQLSDAGMVFNKKFFCIAVLHIKNLSFENIDPQLNRYTMILPEDFVAYVKPLLGSNQVILLMHYNLEDIHELIFDLHEKLKRQNSLLITVGVGNPTTKLSHISKSYIQAMTALDYRLIKGIDTVIFFDRLVINSTNTATPIKFITEKLGVSIKDGDIESVKKIMSDTVSFLKEKDTPISVARMLCFDIINTVAKSMGSLSRKHPLSSEVYPDVFALSEFETIDELSRIVHKISLDISAFISSKNNGNNLIEQMIEYINTICCNCDFTVQQVADHFDMLLPNLSQYFKEQTGGNITDYCTEFKIQRAKALLDSNDLPLKEVASQVGYYNVTSFIRRFKQITGMTPGEYRNRIDD